MKKPAAKRKSPYPPKPAAPAKPKETISSLRDQLVDAQVEAHHFRERFRESLKRAARLEVTVEALQAALVDERNRLDQAESIPF